MEEQNVSQFVPPQSSEAPVTKTSFFKNDVTIAAIIGVLTAFLMLPVLKNILPEVNFYYFLTLIVVLPVLAALGMALAKVLFKKIRIIYQLAKFVLVGILNSFLDWGILNLLMYITNIYSGALFSTFKGISFLVSCTNSYFWNKFWTFSQPEEDGSAAPAKSQGAEFIQFFIVSAIALALNLTVATLVVNVLGPQFGISAARWANLGALAGPLIGMT
jgi:putative flippase GtrA